MALTQAPKIIAVVGATGNQGQGVIRALLDGSSDFQVRAITRNPNSPAAQMLITRYPESERLTVVAGSAYDIGGLYDAFKGVYGVFAMTNNFLPGKTFDTEDSLRHELDAGKNIVDAAEKAGIKHFVFSSLPNTAKASNGHYTKVFHFDYKEQIDSWARERLTAVTTLTPG